MRRGDPELTWFGITNILIHRPRIRRVLTVLND
jgi:hypothetical protein